MSRPEPKAPSVSEWHSALDEAAELLGKPDTTPLPDDGTFTTTEMATRLNINNVTAFRRIARAVEAGKLVPVATRRRRSDGAVCPVQGYRLARKDDVPKKR